MSVAMLDKALSYEHLFAVVVMMEISSFNSDAT